MKILHLHLFLVFLFVLGACQMPKNSKDTNESSNSSTDSGEAAFEKYLQQKAAKFIGKKAPDFELTLLDGTKKSLSDVEGKIVLLNFWFSACKPCEVEVPSLNQLLADYGEKGVLIIGAGLDNADKSKQFVDRKDVKYAVAPNSMEISRSYEVSTYPTTYLIDQEGVIQEVFIGASDFDATYTYSEVKPHLEKLLTE